MNNWVTGKVPDAGKGCGLEKRVSEDEMAGWHHRCSGHELGQTSGTLPASSEQSLRVILDAVSQVKVLRLKFCLPN